jgi:iron complex outermembrane receptor protein
VLPTSLFQNTNRNFFSTASGGNSILHDWLIYDPRALVHRIEEFAAQRRQGLQPGGPLALGLVGGGREGARWAT